MALSNTESMQNNGVVAPELKRRTGFAAVGRAIFDFIGNRGGKDTSATNVQETVDYDSTFEGRVATLYAIVKKSGPKEVRLNDETFCRAASSSKGGGVLEFRIGKFADVRSNLWINNLKLDTLIQFHFDMNGDVRTVQVANFNHPQSMATGANDYSLTQTIYGPTFDFKSQNGTYTPYLETVLQPIFEIVESMTEGQPKSRHMYSAARRLGE